MCQEAGCFYNFRKVTAGGFKNLAEVLYSLFCLGFNAAGEMATGWKKIDGIWYYFRNSGAMATGWFEDKEAEAAINWSKTLWYWFDDNGLMATGWKEIDGQWEFFADSGEWLYTWQGN